MRKIVVAGLFLISGFSGLVYEIVWTRIFGLIFGNTTLAISTVLAAFMLGLALGGLLLGKLADRIKVPLKIYALLESGIGAFALLLLCLRNPVDHLFIWLYPLTAQLPFLLILIKFTISFLLMLPATFLMGGTLPVISRAFIQSNEKLGFGIGTLYGINTCGAVLGVFFTGFFLIVNLGIAGSVILAAALNILIACAALLLSRSGKEANVSAKVSTAAGQAATDTKLILWVMGLSGFAALSYEVLWSRILVFVLSNSVYAFALMLTAFLLGIAVGSWLGGWLADRRLMLRSVLGWLETGIAASAVITALVLINLPYLSGKIFPLELSTSWWYLNGLRFLSSVLVMLLPTLLMGLAFPVAAKIVAADISQLGRSLGKLYFYNTLGGVAGSFLTGFFFIRYLGASATMAVMLTVNLLLGLWLLRPQWASGKLSKITFAGLALLGLAVSILAVPRTLFTGTYTTTEKNYPLIDFREGLDGTITVHRSDSKDQGNLRIDVDGLNVAGTSFMLRTLQTLQGHLPPLVHPRAGKVLQIGFGTGQTSYSALLHGIEDYKLVEISADVLDLAGKYFTDINREVWCNPHFKYAIMDGKNFIRYTPDRYDIIMNDANYAVATASASLFTRDHFLSGLHKLKPGGIFSTWMTTDLDPQDFAIVLRTFQSVFPYSLMWMAPNCINKQVVLIGSVQPLQLDFARIQNMMSQPDIRHNLSSVNINSVYDLLDCLVLDSAGIAGIAGINTGINTDEFPVLEFSRQDVRARDLCAFQNLARIMNHPPHWDKLLLNPLSDSVTSRLHRNEIASRLLLRGMLQFYQGQLKGALQTVLDGSRLIPESQIAVQFFRDMDTITGQLIAEAQSQPDNPETQIKLIRQRLALEEYDQVSSQLQNLIHRYPQNAALFYEAARCHLAGGRPDTAAVYFKRALALNPELSAAWYFSGEIERRQNKQEQALDSYQRALALDGRMYEALNAMALIYQARGDYRQAVDLYRRSLSLAEFQPAMQTDLGDCYFNLAEYQQAATCYAAALQSGEPAARLLKKLGSSCYLLEKYSQAASYFLYALKQDSLDAETYYNLGNTRVRQNNLQQAIPCFERAIKLNSTQADYFNNLAMCYSYLGQQTRARQIFDAGLKIHPQSELLKSNLAAMLTSKNK